MHPVAILGGDWARQGLIWRGFGDFATRRPPFTAWHPHTQIGKASTHCDQGLQAISDMRSLNRFQLSEKPINIPDQSNRPDYNIKWYRGSIPSPARVAAWSSRCLRFATALAGQRRKTHFAVAGWAFGGENLTHSNRSASSRRTRGPL